MTNETMVGMEKIAGWITKQWNSSRLIAWGLIIAGMALVFFTAYKPQSPGFSIGLLALVAGIMSIRPKMHVFEKVASMLILVSLTVLEIRAIHRSDDANKSIRDAQNERFNDIAKELKQSIDLGKDQFASTITHVDGVLKTTQEVSLLAKENLENITGGDSFATVSPSDFLGSNTLAVLNVHNYGSQILLGVVVTIYRLSDAPMPGVPVQQWPLLPQSP